MPSRPLAALYLVLCGVALLGWCALAANGVDEIGGLRALGAAEIGVYRSADALKLGDAGIAPESAGTIGGPTLRQSGLCVVGRVARDCNLPLVELPLGAALALGVLLLGVGIARPGARPFGRARRGALLATASLAALLAVSGHANGIGVEADVGAGVRQGVVGLYRAQVPVDAERSWALPRRLAPALPPLPITPYQPDLCLQPWRAAQGNWSGCNVPLVELPLATVWLLGIAGLLVGLLLAAPSVRSRRRAFGDDDLAGRSP